MIIAVFGPFLVIGILIFIFIKLDYSIKTKLIMFGVGLAIWIFDSLVADHVNTTLLAQKYNFERRLAETNLNPTNKTANKYLPSCKLEYKYLIYPYQTCFKFNSAYQDESMDGFYFRAMGTNPRLFAWLFKLSLFNEDYQFENMHRARKLFYIRKDGKIYDLETNNPFGGRGWVTYATGE